MKEIKSNFEACVLFDRKGNVLSKEKPRCKPEPPYCHEADEYNVIPAGIMALYAAPQGTRPYRALIAGKDAVSEKEESCLRESGVVEIKVVSMKDLQPFLEGG